MPCCYLTVRFTVVEWLKEPLAPVMVRTEVPVGVFRLAVTVMVEEPDPVTEVGLKLALAREGNPLTLKLTVPPNPFDGLAVTV